MRRRIPFVVLMLASALCFGEEPDRPADPKSAAKSLAEALVDGDAEAAKKLFDGNDDSQQLIEPMAAVASSFKKLSQAAVIKFGNEAKALFSKSPAEKLLDTINNGDANSDGEEATITRSAAGRDDPIRLRRTDDGWKVSKLPDSLMKNLPQIKVAAKAMDLVAAGVANGEYKTAREAMEAVRVKAHDLSAVSTTASAGSPTTRVAR